jgi:hypothetical protein
MTPDKLISDAALAVERYGEDELERFARTPSHYFYRSTDGAQVLCRPLPGPWVFPFTRSGEPMREPLYFDGELFEVR